MSCKLWILRNFCGRWNCKHRIFSCNYCCSELILPDLEFGKSHDEDLQYTSAVTLTKESFHQLRDSILETLKHFEKVTDDAEPKHLAYLNIDWIRVT